jgi:hypothetical protein
VDFRGAGDARAPPVETLLLRVDMVLLYLLLLLSMVVVVVVMVMLLLLLRF